MTVYLESIYFPLSHQLDYTDQILYFNSTYRGVYLITHRDIYYLQMEQFLALYVLMGFWICWDYWYAFYLYFGHYGLGWRTTI
jgi:hypothetical protein